MAQPNPFEQPAPQAPAQQPAAPAPAQQPNPYAQPAAPAPQAQQPSPFAPAVPQQPQYAPPAPQAYAPPQQPQYAPPAQPQYAPPAPQGPYGQTAYGQAPAAQQAAPAQVPAGPPPVLHASALNAAPPPPPSGEGRGAKFAHMYGRLCMFLPQAIARRPRNPQYITAEQRQRGDLEQDQLTATVVVLDDGQGGNAPIMFGGDPAAFPPIPDTESAALPYVRKGMWITQSKVIEQLKPHLPSPANGNVPGMVVGRLRKAGPQRNDPWFIEPANGPELERAGQYLALVQAGTFPHPLG